MVGSGSTYQQLLVILDEEQLETCPHHGCFACSWGVGACAKAGKGTGKPTTEDRNEVMGRGEEKRNTSVKLQAVWRPGASGAQNRRDTHELTI